MAASETICLIHIFPSKKRKSTGNNARKVSPKEQVLGETSIFKKSYWSIRNSMTGKEI